MNKALLTLIAASVAAGCSPSSAQTAQDDLNAEYDRANAAGYKALFLCGALANAERTWETRSVEHITEMELTGIYPAYDDIVRDLPHEIRRNSFNVVDTVSVTWSDEMPPRIAQHRGDGKGCAILPIGHELPTESLAEGVREPEIRMWSQKVTSPIREQLEGAFAGEYGEGARTTAVIVNRGDTWIDWSFAEGYTPYMPQRTWSVAKSIAATLVGAAVQRGDADVNASAMLGAGEGDARQEITIDHALRMASGRYSDTPGNRTDPLYVGGTTVEERAQNWPLIREPGTVFRYANNDTLAAVEAIEDTFAEHPPTDFFARVGMQDTVAETDWQGNYVLSSQVWASPMDFLRLGQLYLNDGVLPGGERILPEGWAEYVSTPSGPQPQGDGWGYGAGWWLLNNYEGIPEDTYLAAGNRGQYIVIVPSRNIVIVRRGEDMVGTRFDIAAFTHDVLAALGD